MTIKESILVIFLYLIPIIGFASMDSLWAKFLVATILSIPGIIYIIKNRDLLEISYIGDWKKSLLFEFVWLFPVLIIIYFFGNEIRELLLTRTNFEGTLRSSVSPLIFILIYGIMSSPLQELIFRGVMMHHFEKIFKLPLVSVVITSLVFGLSHIWYPSISLVYITIILGLLWGFSRVKYNSLVGPSLGHAIIGIVGFLFNIV
jgi:membrane protease YdiL (CAAX protease family)